MAAHHRDFGDDKERVLRKADGDSPTRRRHRLPPRQVPGPRLRPRSSTSGAPTTTARWPSLKAGVEALGVERDELEVLLGQMISLTSGRIGRSGPATWSTSTTSSTRSVRRDAAPLAAQLDRPGVTIDLDKVRPRVEGDAGLLRAVRQRPDRLHRAQGRGAAWSGGPSTTSTCLLTRARARARGAALALRAARGRALACTTGRRTRSPRGCAELADRFHGFYHDCYVLGTTSSPSSPRPGCGSSRPRAWGSRSGSTCSGCPHPRRCEAEAP